MFKKIITVVFCISLCFLVTLISPHFVKSKANVDHSISVQSSGHTGACLVCHYVSDLHAHEEYERYNDCTQCHDGTPQAGNVKADKCVVCHPTGDPGKCSLVNYHGTPCQDCHTECPEGTTTTTTAEEYTSHTGICLDCHKFVEGIHTKHESADCSQCHEGTPGEGNVYAETCSVCHLTDDPGKCGLVNYHHASCLECHTECSEGTTTTAGPSATTTIPSFSVHMEICSECHYASDLHKKEKHDDGDCSKCHDGTPGEGNVEPGTCIICHPTDDPGMCSLVNGHGGSCLECHFNCAEGMTTTTIINTSSTTTVTQPCPSTLALQRDIERLQTLRAFRDEVLCTSTLGKTYTDLYYQYAPEISLMMLSDEGLRLEAAEVLGNLLPEIEAIMIDGEGTISAEVIAEVESLLDNFAANASPELKSVIKIVKADVERGKIVGGAIVKKLLDSDHPPP